jgi:hypothetical protein
VLLDTTVLIDALRSREGADRVRALRRAGDSPFVCAVNIEEIWRGIRPMEMESVRRLIGALRIAPLGRAEGELAGSWRRHFAREGVTLHQADCLIAAAAVGVSASLATANVEDFPMEELDLRRWPVSDR